MLTEKIEVSLLHRMLQALKNAIKNKYFRVYIKQLAYLLKLLPSSNKKLVILKTIFFRAPLYMIMNRGETLFKVK